MKKNDKSFWLNILKTALVVCILLGILMIIDNRSKKSEPESGESLLETKEEAKEFRQSEKTLWNLFLEEAKKQNYIHEDELDSIDLVEIIDYGRYIKERPNIRYEQISFEFTCKDKTTNCLAAELLQNKDTLPIYKKYVIINLETKDIQIVSGLTFKISDNLVPINGPFVFPGEE